MTYEKKQAFEFLTELFNPKDKYTIVKVSAKEDRPVSVYVGENAKGRANVFKVYERWPEAVENGEFSRDDFYIRVEGEGFEYIRTSPIQRVGVTPDGVILAETLNSIYRIEKAGKYANFPGDKS